MGGYQVLGEVDLEQNKASSGGGLQILGEEDLPSSKTPEETKFENKVQSKAIASVPKPAFLSGQPHPVNVLPGPFGFENEGGIAPVGPKRDVPALSAADYVKAGLSFTPPQSETETIPGAPTEISAAQHLATPGKDGKVLPKPYKGLAKQRLRLWVQPQQN